MVLISVDARPAVIPGILATNGEFTDLTSCPRSRLRWVPSPRAMFRRPALCVTLLIL